MLQGFLLVAAQVVLAAAALSGEAGGRSDPAPSPAWKEDLWVDGGGYWTNRLVLTFANDGAQAWSNRTVSVRMQGLGLSGREISDSRGLRLTDEDGCEVLFDRRKVKGTDSLVLPISVPAKGCARYCLYFGNGRAWELPKAWRKKTVAEVRPTVARETIALMRTGGDAPWPDWARREAGWFRVPLRVANFSEADRGEELAVFNLAEAAHAAAHPSVVLMRDGAVRPCAPYGNLLVFPVRVPPRTVETYRLYVKPGGSPAADDAVSGIAGDFMLANTQTRRTVSFEPREAEALSAIVKSPLNLLADGLYESGERWTFSGTKGATTVRRVSAGGILGEGCGVVDQPTDKTHWTGIRQKLSLAGGRTYFCGVLVNSEMAKGEWWLRAAGGSMEYALRNATGGWTAEWFLSRVAQNCTATEFATSGRFKGRVSVDAAILAPYAQVTPGAREYPTRETTTLAVCQVDTMEKVFPDERRADARNGWRISLARNEDEDVQLAVRSDRPIGRLALSVDRPTDDRGVSLDCETQFTELVPVDATGGFRADVGNSSHLRHPPRVAGKGDGWRGLWPDPLVRTNACRLAAGETRTFRIVVRAHDCAPGVYRGRVRWSADGKTVRTDPLTVKVWNFDVGRRPAFTATYDIRFERSYWLGPGEKTFEAARERLVDLMAEYKIAPEQFRYGTIFSRDAAGNIVADYAEHDRGAEDFFGRRGFRSAYFPRTPFYVFGYSWKIRPFLGEEPYEPGETDSSRLRPAYRRAYQTALRMYWQHIREKGWADKMVLYVSDEPTYWDAEVRVRLKAVCAMIREVDPQIPVYSSTWAHVPDWDGSVTVWGAGSYGCFPVEAMRAVKRGGARLWFTTDGQLELTTPYCAIEQLLPVYAHFYGAEKYEYWGVNWVTLPPWKFGYHDYAGEGAAHVRGCSGSGFVAYPPRPGDGDARPCPSIRLAAARDGVELHAYLTTLARLARGTDLRRARAQELLRRFESLVRIPNAGGRLSTVLLRGNPRVLSRLREEAGELLATGFARDGQNRSHSRSRR